MSTVPTGEDASLYSGGSFNSGETISPSTEDFTNELQGLSLEECERQKAEWTAELTKKIKPDSVLTCNPKQGIMFAKINSHNTWGLMSSLDRCQKCI